MIRINLLKPLQTPSSPIHLAEPAGKRKQAVLLAAGLVVIALGATVVLQYPGLLGGLLGGGEDEAEIAEAPAAPEPAPAAAEPAAQPKRVTSDAVEEIVREIQEEQGRQGPAASYADLVPSEKIEFQYFAATRILKDIKAVTPPDVGFSNFIFTPPGDFYIHGLAYDEETYQRFRDALSGLEGASIRPGISSKSGARGTSREFSFYGTVKYPVKAIPQPPDRVLKKQDVQAELKRLKEVAASLGIALRSPKLKSTSDAGDYRRMIFQASADCSYQQMQDLLAQLRERNSNLGFLKFALKASGDESVTASLDILAYVD